MIITSAGAENIRELYELQLIAFESEAEMIGSRSVPALMESYEEFAADFPHWTTLVGKNEDGRIIGSARYKITGDTVEVGRVMVDPACRNRGIAIALMNELEEQSEGSRFELYTCTKSHINLRLYEKLGYRVFKEEKGERELSFAYMEKTV